MENNYMEFAEWIKHSDISTPRLDKNLVAFLAVREHVKASMAAGHTLKTIWKYLSAAKKISCCYATFLKHIQRHIMQVSTNQVENSSVNPKNELKIPSFMPSSIPKEELY